MEKVIFPLYTLPPLGYIQAVLQCKTAYLSIGENFEKQTYRSRFEIMSPNKRQLLSVPLVKGKSSVKMREVQISYDEPWQKRHWHAMETAYDNSPFFPFYDFKLKPVFMNSPIYLWEYNLALLQTVIDCLRSQVQLEITEEEPNSEFLIASQEVPMYDQVFSDRHGFMANLSIVDWIFNIGA